MHWSSKIPALTAFLFPTQGCTPRSFHGSNTMDIAPGVRPHAQQTQGEWFASPQPLTITLQIVGVQSIIDVSNRPTQFEAPARVILANGQRVEGQAEMVGNSSIRACAVPKFSFKAADNPILLGKVKIHTHCDTNGVVDSFGRLGSEEANIREFLMLSLRNAIDFPYQQIRPLVVTYESCSPQFQSCTPALVRNAPLVGKKAFVSERSKEWFARLGLIGVSDVERQSLTRESFAAQSPVEDRFHVRLFQLLAGNSDWAGALWEEKPSSGNLEYFRIPNKPNLLLTIPEDFDAATAVSGVPFVHPRGLPWLFQAEVASYCERESWGNETFKYPGHCPLRFGAVVERWKAAQPLLAPIVAGDPVLSRRVADFFAGLNRISANPATWVPEN